jgi:putative ABC transport system ATP-binding protein
MTDAAILIRTENLQRHFTMGDQIVRALDGVTITVAPGEFIAVMGPSGSGKSTLLYLLGGLDRPTGGKVWIDDYELSTLDENRLASYRQRDVGFIFQSFYLIPTMTALQNVMFPMIFNHRSKADRLVRAGALLEAVGLSDRMHHRPTELSGGQQQRVAIARALANSPRIILADEPTGNLDTHTGMEIIALLAHLNADQHHTVVIVSHDPTVATHATRSLTLQDGRVV